MNVTRGRIFRDNKSRLAALGASIAVVAAPLAAATPANAAVGGSAEAQALEVGLDVGLEALGLPGLGSLVTLNAATPAVLAPLENNTFNESTIGLDVDALAASVTTGAVTTRAENNTDNLFASSSVDGTTLNVLGAELLTLGAVDTSARCTVGGLIELDSSLVDATISGIPVTLEANSSVSGAADVEILGLEAATVNVNLQLFEDQATATAGLRADLSISATVPVVGTAVNANLGTLTIAESSCTVPTAASVVAPTATSLTPNAGFAAGGETVTVTGTDFTPDSTVTFNGAPAADVTYISPESLSFVTPASAVTGPLPVVVSNGAESSAPLEYTVNAPTITEVAPASGSIDGGEAVTITGTGFTPDVGITFDGIPATEVTYVSPTQVNAVTPAHAAGAVDVVALLPGLNATAASAYVYLVDPVVTEAPVLSSITPDSGMAAGGDEVTIVGEGFTPDSVVYFGEDSAADVTVVSPTEITVVTPPSVGGVVPVTVVNGTETSAPLEFEFIAPDITDITPDSGSTVGGTVVTLSGEGFYPGAVVVFGDQPATVLDFAADNSSMRVVAPANPVGPVEVSVTHGLASSSVPEGYIYVAASPEDAPLPVIDAVTPPAGSEAGGDLVVVSGENFENFEEVLIGGVSGIEVYEDSATSISFITPAALPGVAEVVVITEAGASLPAEYTYNTDLVVDAIAPDSGSTDGGTEVTIIGSGMTGETEVSFDGIPAASVEVISGTEVIATTPAVDLPGAADVTVTLGDGQSETLVDAFEFVLPEVTPPTDGGGLPGVDLGGGEVIVVPVVTPVATPVDPTPAPSGNGNGATGSNGMGTMGNNSADNGRLAQTGSEMGSLGIIALSLAGIGVALTAFAAKRRKA